MILQTDRHVNVHRMRGTTGPEAGSARRHVSLPEMPRDGDTAARAAWQRALLAALQRIERDAGRVREERWGARTLDLDIVKFANHQATDPDLTLPHPGLETREFWQRELAELGVAS